MSTPRVRFAPAPTGFLHVGSARTALFNWLFARHSGGQFLLRIEDTDLTLRTAEYVDAITRSLQWLGLDWDSGPHFQSERKELHNAALSQLLTRGFAYYCDLTPQDVAQRCAAEGLPQGYHGWSRDRDVRDGPGAVVRFRCPQEGETVVDDVVRGRVAFPNDALEDFVIRRSDGTVTFHLANAVDDHDMGITHVIRGEDLLNTTPRVRLLWQALGYGQPPVYVHLPLLVNAKRQKLSKRRDEVALDYYRDCGYLPEAMVSYLALLGWSPPDDTDVLPLPKLIKLFDLREVKSAPAFFDLSKLNSINAACIRAFTADEFATRVEPFLTGGQEDVSWPPECYDADVVRSLAGEIAQRISVLSEAAGWLDWILNPDVSYHPKAWDKAMVKGRAAREVLSLVAEHLVRDDFASAERLQSIVMGVGDELTERLGVRVRSQPPVRVALSGKDSGLPLWEPMRLLGKEMTLARVEKARERL